MRLKIYIVALMALLSTAYSYAEKKVIEEISFPIMEYKNSEEGWVAAPNGEIVLQLIYWDTFKTPNLNKYSVDIRAYKDKSRNQNSRIYQSKMFGRTQSEVNRNSWGRTYWAERRPNQDGIKHYIAYRYGQWDTRFGYLTDGRIFIMYGLVDESTGTRKRTDQSLRLVGGEANWNRLLSFLRKAHRLNIGKTS